MIARRFKLPNEVVGSVFNGPHLEGIAVIRPSGIGSDRVPL